MNLSGKKTSAGRNSGECFSLDETTKEESRKVKLSGEKDRDPFLKGVSLSFFVCICNWTNIRRKA